MLDNLHPGGLISKNQTEGNTEEKNADDEENYGVQGDIDRPLVGKYYPLNQFIENGKI